MNKQSSHLIPKEVAVLARSGTYVIRCQDLQSECLANLSQCKSNHSCNHCCYYTPLQNWIGLRKCSDHAWGQEKPGGIRNKQEAGRKYTRGSEPGVFCDWVVPRKNGQRKITNEHAISEVCAHKGRK